MTTLAHTGPMTGPNNGPIDQIAMAPARRSTGIMSAIVPDPIVTGVDPKQPARKRNAMSEDMLFEKEQARLNSTKKTFVVLYSQARPYISLRGAIINGPTANPRI